MFQNRSSSSKIRISGIQGNFYVIVIVYIVQEAKTLKSGRVEVYIMYIGVRSLDSKFVWEPLVVEPFDKR